LETAEERTPQGGGRPFPRPSLPGRPHERALLPVVASARWVRSASASSCRAGRCGSAWRDCGPETGRDAAFSRRPFPRFPTAGLQTRALSARGVPNGEYLERLTADPVVEVILRPAKEHAAQPRGSLASYRVAPSAGIRAVAASIDSSSARKRSGEAGRFCRHQASMSSISRVARRWRTTTSGSFIGCGGVAQVPRPRARPLRGLLPPCELRSP